MDISLEFATHEVGHMVIGFHFDLVEQGIVFQPLPPGDGAHALYNPRDAQTSLVRCFGGILAHLYVLPQTIKPHLRLAYTHSVVIEKNHPYFETLTEQERMFLDGAKTDVELAFGYAAQIEPSDPASIALRMKEAEDTARKLIMASGRNISVIASDVVAFGLEPEQEDLDEHDFVCYSAQRARKAVISREASS